MSEPELSTVLAELRELRAEVTTLRAQVAESTSSTAAVRPAPHRADAAPGVEVDGNDAVSRRHALRTAGMVAAGALAGGAALAAAASPAAAASGSFDGNPAVTAVGSPAVQADTTSTTQDAIRAVANFANSNGVYATAVASNSIGVLGIGTRAGVWGAASNNGTSGVVGEAQNYGLHGVRGIGSNSAVGVRAESGYIAVDAVASGSGTGVRGQASGGGVAVRGSNSGSGNGGLFESGTGVAAFLSGRYGALVEGVYTALILKQVAFDPSQSSNTSSAGYRELTPGPNGVLWYNVAPGTPGTWRTLAGPNSAGAFYAVTPGRVYDSRLGTYPQSGVLASGQNRTLSVANSYDTNGALVTTNFVPAGATAVFANVTIVDTAVSGYLAVNPGGTTTVAASTINWSSSGQILANGISLTLNASRQVTVVAGGSGSTNFIIDITGYWM